MMKTYLIIAFVMMLTITGLLVGDTAFTPEQLRVRSQSPNVPADFSLIAIGDNRFYAVKIGNGLSVSLVNGVLTIEGGQLPINTEISKITSPTSVVTIAVSNPLNLRVFRNGQRVTLAEDYSITGQTITFVRPLDTDDIVIAEYW
jgi:hypothetical protein